MFCGKCSSQVPDGTQFCPNCGAPIAQPQASTFVPPVQPQATYAAPANPVAAKFTSHFSDVLFMVMCILVSASALLSLVGALAAGSLSLPIFPILFTIFMWIIFVGIKQNKPLTGKNMRYISGTVFAYSIVTYVAAGALVLLGLLVMVSSSMLRDMLGYEAYVSLIYTFKFLFNGADPETALVMLGFVLWVVAVVVFLMGFLGYRNIHKLAKSMYQSVDSGVENLEKLSTAKTWMMVLGVLNGISALTTLTNGSPNAISFLATGAIAGAYIVAFIWLGKIQNSNNY